MMKVSIRQLRSNTREIIDSVKRGETVIITSHGKPCGEIIPYQKQPKIAKADKAFGMWENHKENKDVNEYVRKLRKRRDVC